MTRIVGGCLCGAIRYRAEEQTRPVITVVCHARDCQKLSGSAFAILLAVPKGKLHFTGPSPSSYTSRDASNLEVTHRFCPHCGSPLVSEMTATPALVWLKAGTLDNPSWVRPQANIWCETALPWVSISEEIPRFLQEMPMGRTG